MACNLYIEQIERASGYLLGNCSCGQPVGSHLHEAQLLLQVIITFLCAYLVTSIPQTIGYCHKRKRM